MIRNSATVLLAIAMGVQGYAQQATLKGIESSDLDRKVQPCDNFYEFSNGAWRAANPIPASMDRWSRRWQAGEVNKDKLRIILDEIAAQPSQASGTPAQLTGDFYAACTNVKAIDDAGATPLKPYLARIDAIHDSKELQREMRDLQAIGVTVPFLFGSVQNVHEPNNIIAGVSASGLGLPDRDYYVKPEKRFADARAAYLVYIAKLFTLTGVSADKAQASAQTVMQIETALAKASLDNVALRDPHATDHIADLDALQKMTPHFDWTAFYQNVNVQPGVINIDQPVFMAEFDRQLASTSLADWKTYLRWQLLNSEADTLSQPFVDAHFGFYQKQLAGVGELKPRGTRCAEQTDQYLGEALGQEYVKRYFPPAAKQRAQDMVTNILSAMHDTIGGLDWMTPPTKQKALEKLASVNVKVGYPDKWKDYSSITITRSDYFADSIAGNRFQVADDRTLINKPVDRSRWGMTPPTSNAYYNPVLNEIVFPAGILQPPAFGVNAADAVNYGAIGVVIGHEISHGFDDQGSQFDATGKLENWWTPDDLAKFKTKTGCVVNQFNAFTIDGAPDIHINGNLVLGESIGDLAGLKIAYLAFKKTPQGQSNVKIDGFTPDQQFFIAWGQFRGDETRPETQKLMVQGDPHPVAKYRVLGPLSNFAPFAEAFSCKSGSAMTRSATDRCIVW
ncbi:M13 family metallopeptidase [Granulicella arctica]|uniref:Endothelin-converting enzyme/putative endopeptidase n=1 Tax=Granulicella arctica TaxID=940613 RepID=A0A7Y9PJP7_9BACT|nr:M13 family metallopeptidase [Granulicella arctica]NYF81014.1 endothelin-converting enzyme/putative endopeptidase [Granulicella arctica]